MAAMTKREAQNAVERIFGPKAECVRVSARDRGDRFQIFGGVQSSLGAGAVRGYEPIPLGSGASWESAIDHAHTTPNGKLAIKEAQAGKELAKKALQSKSALEFAQFVEDDIIQKAIEDGATEAQVAELKQKFAKAKEMINEHEHNESEDQRQVGQDAADRAGDEGSGGEDE